jgi:hypothetical protein
MEKLDKQAIAIKLRELADLFDPQVVSAEGGGTGNGPPDND